MINEIDKIREYIMPSKDETKHKRMIMKRIIVAIVLLACPLLVSAIPVPHGVDGIIYELDGITQVQASTNFSVNDTTTGEIITGKTGYGSSGGYSVSLNGNDGDTVVIKAWNKLHRTNTTIILQSVMRNVNLLLNMTIPNVAPNITSAPTTNATQDELYLYNITAIDEEESPLIYTLVTYPSGMVIGQTSGLIVWTPNKNQVGNNTVDVQVSDGELNFTQEFTISVANVNDAPVIISDLTSSLYEGTAYLFNLTATDIDSDNLSYYLARAPYGMTINSTSGLIEWTPLTEQYGYNEIIVGATDGTLATTQSYGFWVEIVNDAPVISSSPPTSAVIGQLYSYNVNATDPDLEVLRYGLLINPDGMTINQVNGTIEWVPTSAHGGNNSVAVQATDGELSAAQTFSIYVPPITVLETRGSQIQSGSPGSTLPSLSPITDVIIKTKDGKTPSISIIQFTERPAATQSISRRVYRYVEIKKESNSEIESATIKFRVEKSWLSKYGLDKNDIVLTRYDPAKREWLDIYTTPTIEGADYEYYEAETPGFSYFAITIKESSLGKVREVLEPKISKIKAPYRITGIIYNGSRQEQLGRGTEISIKNSNTNEATYGKTGIGRNNGAYLMLVYGSIGDTIEVALKEFGKPFKTTLTGDIDSLNLMLKRETAELTSITEITEPEVVEPESQKIIPEKSILITLAAIVIILILFDLMEKFIDTKKNKNGKKRDK